MSSPCSPIARPDRHRRSERATSLLEVVMTMSLFLLVLGALLETQTSFLFASNKQDQAIEARSVSRLAVIELGGVIRSADTVWPPAGASAARTELTITAPRKDGAGNEIVRLRLDSSTDEIVREVLDAPGGAVVSRRLVAAGATNPGTPFVRYFDRSGGELDPGLVGMAPLVGCAMRFEITVGIVPSSGRTPVVATAPVTPRNRRAEELSC